MKEFEDFSGVPFGRELMDLRSNIAVRDKVGVYAVFSNEQLLALSEVKPKTIKDLASISGFPENGARVTRWGKEIVGVFTNVSVNAKSNVFG